MLQLDPARLAITPTPEVFAQFIHALDTLSLANLTDRLGETYGDRTAFVLEQPLALPGVTDTTVSFAEMELLRFGPTDSATPQAQSAQLGSRAAALAKACLAGS